MSLTIASAFVLTLAPLQAKAQSPDSVVPDARCGSHCLFIALDALGLAPANFDALEAALGPPPAKGYSLLQLDEAAKKYGASTIAVSTSLENLQDRPRPFCCITLVDDTHFVLLYDIDDTSVHIVDYPREYSVSRDAFASRWGRSALLLAASPLAPEESIEASRKWRQVLVVVAAAVVLLGVVGLIWAARNSGMWRLSTLNQN